MSRTIIISDLKLTTDLFQRMNENFKNGLKHVSDFAAHVEKFHSDVEAVVVFLAKLVIKLE